jgi:hypothetical protein
MQPGPRFFLFTILNRSVQEIEQEPSVRRTIRPSIHGRIRLRSRCWRGIDLFAISGTTLVMGNVGTAKKKERTMRIDFAWPAILILSVDTLPGLIDASQSKYRVSLGYGAAKYEYKTFDCSGHLLDAEPVDLEGGGVEADFWPAHHWRMSGFVGYIGDDRIPPGADHYGGVCGGFLPAWEGGAVGLGLGITGTSGREGFLAPSLYLRFGNVHHAHFRLETLAPSPTFATDSWARLGIAWNQGGRSGTRGYVGLGILPYSYDDDLDPRFFADLDVPLGRSVGLLGKVQIGGGASRTQWSAATGLRFAFGSVPRPGS